MKKTSFRTWLLVCAVSAVIAIAYSVANREPPPTELTFSEFASAIDAGEIADATLYDLSLIHI